MVKNYDQSVKTMTKAVVEVAEQTMAEAAHDLKSSKGQLPVMMLLTLLSHVTVLRH